MDGQDLKLIRSVLGLTRQEMADRLCVRAGHIAHTEEGDRDVSIPLHGKIMRIMRSDEFERKMARIKDIKRELDRLEKRGDLKGLTNNNWRGVKC